MKNAILKKTLQLAIVIFILYALLTHDNLAPSFFNTSNPSVLEVIIPASYISDALMQMFGITSMIFFTLLLIYLMALYRCECNIELLVMGVIFMTYGFTNVFQDNNFLEDYNAGGILGNLMRSLFSGHEIFNSVEFGILYIALGSACMYYGYGLVNFINLTAYRRYKATHHDIVDVPVVKSTIKAKVIKTIPSNKYQLPPVKLLAKNNEHYDQNDSRNNIENLKSNLLNTLQDFNIQAEVITYDLGPIVSRIEIEPAAGVKISRIISLSNDIARAMSVISTRVYLIPGKKTIGIEIPNLHKYKVVQKDITEDLLMHENKYTLPIAIGKTINNKTYIMDIADMPHLMIAGTTGSGKSVFINSLIQSILFTRKPDECKFIMIDPKMLELSQYDKIPHLISNVITDVKDAVNGLKWAVKEMERRYKVIHEERVKDINSFNRKIKERNLSSVEKGGDKAQLSQTLHRIVIIIDELADLMLTSGKEIEQYLQRLAQMARACGIHVIIATQRPSVDVITGVIKANFPTRISFCLSSRIDSRTILGESGAEQLLGKGDMLISRNGEKPLRLHGAYVTELEVEKIVTHLSKYSKSQNLIDFSNAQELQIGGMGGMGGMGGSREDDGQDPLLQEAIDIAKKEKRISISFLQRKLRIGYNRSARIIEQMENMNALGSKTKDGKREFIG